jgi:hypothetical protein
LIGFASISRPVFLTSLQSLFERFRVVPAVLGEAGFRHRRPAIGWNESQPIYKGRELVLRSWFWNMMLAAVMLAMASIATGEVVVSGVGSGNVIAAAIFGVLAVMCWIGMFRALMLGVKIRPDSIVARGLGRTTVIRFEEMDRVETDGLISGAATLGGAITPVVYWRRPEDSEIRRTDLSMLGGYVLGPRRPTRMERNTATIQEHLSRWREQKEKPT